MSDFRNVRSGEPLRIKAPLQNALINNLFDREFRGRDIHGTAAFNQFVNNQRVVVRVKNTSGTDINQYGILGLDTLIGTPGESPGDELEDEPTFLDYGFIGKDPDEDDHKIRFCVAQQFIADGDVGTALISGTTPVKIDLPGGAKIVGQDLPRVGIKTGDKTKLFQQPWGAQVIWVDTEKAIDESFASWAIIDMGRQQPISGIPGKAKAAIAALATGNIIETLADATPTEKGAQFTARNMGSTVALNDRIVWGVDRKGDAFFIAAESAGECGPGDCPDSCDPTTFCFEVSWEQGMASGSFFIEVAINRECMGFNDAVTNPNGAGSVTDPTTGRNWTLDVTWDLCLQSTFYIATDCANFPVNWEAGQEPINMGGTCPNQIDITAIDPVPGTCSGSSTFPCCDSSEGCTCL